MSGVKVLLYVQGSQNSASIALKYHNRAYHFFGRVVACQNIQNPTYNEL